MTLYRKSVILKDWNIQRDAWSIPLSPTLEASHIPISIENEESYLTLISNSKEEINNKLSQFPVLSDRARTLKSIPKMRIIQGKVERIQ